MRGLRVVLSSACVAVLLASAQPAAAFHEDLDVVASEELSSGDWVAFRIRVHETTMVAEGGSTSSDSLYSYAADASWRLDGDGNYKGASVGQSWRASFPTIYLHTDETGTVSRREQTAGPGGGGSWGGSEYEPGEYVFVMTAGAVGPSYSYTAEILAEGDVELIGMTRGSSGFLHRQEDFEGTVSFHGDGRAVAAKAMLGGSVSEDAGTQMFAMLRDGGDVTFSDARIVGPEGFSPRGFYDPVIFGSWQMAVGGPAGAYSFEAGTSASASALFPADILAIGADVTLP